MVDCKDCEHLIKRYGFCPVVNDWVEDKKDWLSFDWRSYKK